MTTIEDALVTYVNANAGITALQSTRFYPKLPQNPTLPASVYQDISTPRVMSHSGYSNLAMPRKQITIFATTYASAKAVADAFRAALIGFKGTMSGIRIDAIYLADERSNFEPTTQYFERSLDFIIHHFES